MEVHHHPDLHHRHKKIKEYFLEFFMLFLAVSLGFFAESLRENLSDREKEKQYIESLVANAEQDSSSMRTCIAENENKLKGLDSLRRLSLKDPSLPGYREALYAGLNPAMDFYSTFTSYDATMMQLKNSGGLRLIRHAHVSDSIAKYDFEVREIYAAEVPYSKSVNDGIDAMEDVIDFAVFRDTSYYKNGKFTGRSLPLLVDNPQQLKKFFNKVTNERGWVGNYTIQLKERLPFVIRFINYLKKEYDLE